MPEVMMIIIDNSFSSQNQDYHPSRFLIQKEAAQSIISKKLQESPENEVGIAPLCIQDFNIMTPSTNKNHINYFLSKIDLCGDNDKGCVVDSCIKALNLKSQTNKDILIFIGSSIQTPSTMISNINKAIEQDFHIKICFFGDGIKYSEMFENEIYGENYVYCVVGTDEEVYGSVMNLFGDYTSEMEDDPELAMAIKMSLEDQARNK